MTVTMLYVYNLRERELSQRRMVRLFGFMGVVVVLGGWIGSLYPNLSSSRRCDSSCPSRSPVTRTSPRSWRSSSPRCSR
ncbi:hypothetical protein V2I01_12690 [Micromonospora sp. BRA006-A]|nr:hypothetical protein [Micromonospora sp. BRA006-A]